MKTRLLNFWISVRTSYWFLPTLMTVGAFGLAMLMVAVDQNVDYDTEGVWWMYSGGHDGARAVLSTIASSMITVAGVVFSITIVALTLASTQFGPRLLRNFMSDVGNQFVLGAFVATYLYCLLILRMVRGLDGNLFVPHLSVTMGMALAILGVGVLIYFIHHVASSIQAQNVIANVARETQEGLDRLFPEEIGDDAEEVAEEPQDETWTPPDDWEERALPLRSAISGYLQVLDDAALMRIACENDVLLCVSYRPGEFINREDVLALVYPRQAGVELDGEVYGELAATFVIGSQRTPTQDAEYSVHQLVEIAVRALSPGINDPFTAITCIDWLAAVLAEMARRRIPSAHRFDDEETLRVVVQSRTTFPGMVDAAFNQIRQNAGSTPAVLIRLLEVIEHIAVHVRRRENRQALAEQARCIREEFFQGPPRNRDQADVEERYQRVLQLL